MYSSNYTVRPTSNGERILAEDLVVSANTVYSAKEKARAACPGCDSYIIIDIERIGWSAIQRDREKSGFGISW
jgi:hypothetical protein